MKKIILFAIILLTLNITSFAQYPGGGAHNTTATPDVAPISISAVMTDMFDMAPTAGQTGSTDFTANWDAWNDGLDIDNINVPGNTYYFLVSATRGFYLNIAATDLTFSGDVIPARHIIYAFKSNNGGGPNGNWDVAKTKNGRCTNTQQNIATTTFGGYDMRFIVDLRLDESDGLGNDLYSYDLNGGTYNGVVTVYGGLN